MHSIIIHRVSLRLQWPNNFGGRLLTPTSTAVQLLDWATTLDADHRDVETRITTCTNPLVVCKGTIKLNSHFKVCNSIAILHRTIGLSVLMRVKAF